MRSRIKLLATCCVFLLTIIAARAQPAATNSAWERIVMLGASATAGFTASEPLGGPATEKLRLNRYFDAALREPHPPARNLASAFFFLQPDNDARRQIDAAIAAKPTVVVALDFLFWFCYGDATNETQRLKRFETGLKFLDELHAPIVVGDLPDASAATEMLEPDVIPSGATRLAANQRLKEWAAARKQVVVVSLSDFMRTALANESLTVHGRTLPAGKTRGLLQGDKLHPGARGCSVLALACLDALPFARGGEEVRWDPAEEQRLATASITNAPVQK